MKNHSFYFLLTLISLGVMSCSQQVRTYKGEIVKIDYDRIDTIKDGSWIKIDRWKFPHIQSRLKAKETPFSLPTSFIMMDSTNMENPRLIKVDGRVIGLDMINYLDIINRDSLKAGMPKYVVINPALISVKGVLILAKADSSVIKVTVPKNYPAVITTEKR